MDFNVIEKAMKKTALFLFFINSVYHMFTISAVITTIYIIFKIKFQLNPLKRNFKSIWNFNSIIN